jgi:hypothetical protein
VPSVKTAISLDRDLLAAAEASASELGLSRSGLIARALAEFLARQRRGALTRQMDEVLRDEPPDEEEMRFLDAAARRHLAWLQKHDPWP